MESITVYPELESQLAAVQPRNPTGLIVVEERIGKPYQHRRMSTVHRLICDEAKLSRGMTFTGSGTAVQPRSETQVKSIFARCPATYC